MDMTPSKAVSVEIEIANPCISYSKSMVFAGRISKIVGILKIYP